MIGEISILYCDKFLNSKDINKGTNFDFTLNKTFIFWTFYYNK